MFPGSTPEIDTTAFGGSYYIDNDLCQLECAYSIWIYEESNGIAGLQRADPVTIAFGGVQWA